MAQGRPRKIRSDSSSEMVKRLSRSDGTIAVPDGMNLETEELRVIWDQFTRARRQEDWRDMDLVLLEKVVRFEVKIRDCERVIQDQGMILETKRGTPIKNPLVDIQDGYLRQMLAVIRTMSLGTNGQDRRTLANNKHDDDEAARKLREMGAPKLLAV